GTGPWPVIICLGGSSKIMDDVERRWAWEPVERGYVSFVLDVRMSRREEVRYRLASIVDDNSAFGILGWDLVAAVDYLVSRPDVDPDRIGCTGVSVGGSETWILAALDRRISAAAPVVGLTTFGAMYENATPMLGYHSDYYWFPGYLKYISDADAPALIAPRPLLNVGGLQDWNLPARGMDQIHRRLSHLYELLGASELIERYDWPGGHGFPPPAREVVYDFFDRHLKPEINR
ncbi:alpha/beta hydrolase family protein, partial [candidate division KSB1 bacterium]